jgi:hypothetical protein
MIELRGANNSLPVLNALTSSRDTNVIVAGLGSRRGSAFQLLSLIDTEQFDIHLSVPLILEYTE